MLPIDSHDIYGRVKRLLKFEEELRADYHLLNRNNIGRWAIRAEELGTTLRDLAVLLLIKNARKANRADLADQLIGKLEPNLQAYVPAVGGIQPELPLG